VPNYTYPGTDTVKNKLGARTHDELEGREAELVFGRATEIRLGVGPKGQFDAAHLKAIHRHLFLAAPLIPAALDDIGRRVREADYLRGLSREVFAVQAADILADLNAIHPFREGNGRTQRTFMRELAREGGHDLDLTVISRERMIEASITANERGDRTVMHRLFRDALDPDRISALREAIEALEQYGFAWNDRYIATAEPGRRVEAVLVGVAGAHFMARTKSQILIGNTADLPNPHPETGETFILDPGRAAGQQ
jgi:cell filamentation protein